MAHATTRIRTCYLVRHAIAEERGPEWPDDRLRPLSADGARRMARTVRGLAALHVSCDLILTSPLVRTLQTADILRRGLGVDDDVVMLSELEPATAPQTAARAIAAATTDIGSFAVVGHEPEIGVLASWLLGAARPIPFKKGAVCRIDVEVWLPRPRAQLVWFASPKMLRQL